MTSAYSEADFDTLATFVAIADELSHEPFLSEDAHDTLRHSGGNSENPVGIFTHPALLKSAATTFRKIWMPDHYDWPNICGLIADKSSNEKHRLLASLERSTYPKSLAKAAWDQSSGLTVEEVFQLWFNTQISHAGPKMAKKTSQQKYDLKDFDQHLQRLGRAKFEFMFRINLRLVAGNIILRCHDFVFPEYALLLQEGFKPGFTAELLLKNNPYPRPECGIVIDDRFWHQNKESADETFQRLIERQRFVHLQSFLRGYFGSSKHAAAAVSRFGTFDELLTETGARIADSKNAVPANCHPAGGHDGQSIGSPTLYGKVEVFSDRVVIFGGQSREILKRSYDLLRQLIYTERMQQRSPKRWEKW